MTTLAIEVDEFLPHAPTQVWRALTDPDLLARWLMPNDFRLELGHRFTFHAEPVPATKFSGLIACQVLEFEPEALLRISWTDADGAPGSLDSTVTWRLEPEGRGTRLFIVHAGFDPDDPNQAMAYRIMSGGWRANGLTRLATFLETLPAP